jgi:hypothetical protein
MSLFFIASESCLSESNDDFSLFLAMEIQQIVCNRTGLYSLTDINIVNNTHQQWYVKHL